MGNLSQEVNLIFLVSCFLLLIAIGIITLVLVYRRKQLEYLNEQNRLKAVYEKELLEAQLEIQEQTMQHLAQEIHDNIGGTLSLAKLNLNTIDLQKQQSVTEKLANTKELVSKAIADLRTLSKTLHKDAVLSAGLAQAIQMELALIDKVAVFETAFTTQGEPIPLDPQKELILFRTVQEALNNAIKHADARRLSVQLHYQPNLLVVTVQDDGKGMDVHTLPSGASRGSGLRNMQNRTALIGGRLQVRNTRPGTQIRLSLPILAP